MYQVNEAFLRFVKDPNQAKFHDNNYGYDYAKIHIQKDYQVVFMEKECTCLHSFFGSVDYYPVCIVNANGEIMAASENCHTTKQRFPDNYGTFAEVTNKVFIKLLKTLWPDILAQKDSFLPENKKGLLSMMFDLNLTRMDLSKTFLENIDFMDFSRISSAAFSEICLEVMHQYDPEIRAAKIRGEMTKPPISYRIADICALYNDFCIAQDIIGTHSEESLNMIKTLKDRLPGNARTGSIVYLRNDGTEMTIPLSFQIAFAFDPNHKFWLGAPFYFDPRNQAKPSEVDGMIKRGYGNCYIIPWNRIKKVIHRGKIIFEQ